MRFGSLKFSLLVSIAFHALVIGLGSVSGFFRQSPGSDPQKSDMVLTIINEPKSADTASVEIASESVTRPSSPQEIPRFLAGPPLPHNPKPVARPVPQAMLTRVAQPSEALPGATTKSELAINAAVAVDVVSSATPTVDITPIAPGSDDSQSSGSPSIPVYRSNPKPDYPWRARRRGLEGVVLLDVEITPEGRVARLSVKKSSGHAVLDEAALEAVRKWEFEPARLGDVPMGAHLEVPVQFQLVR